MKLTTIVFSGIALAAAGGVLAQNGAGSGPPNMVAPAPSVIRPLLPTLPMLLPIRIAATSLDVDSLAIIDRRQRRAAAQES